MHFVVIGREENLEELKQKFSLSHSYELLTADSSDVDDLKNAQVIVDFVVSQNHLKKYINLSIPVFINTAFVTLSQLSEHDRFTNKNIFGFCGLPTFVNRPVLEVTAQTDSMENLTRVCAQLLTDFICVDDRPGMVTPRVIAMIINEAYFTLEEGTANREDIDLAMKLGTNYPYGPFEWAKKIGIDQIVKLLDAVYQDTHDERYQVCNLLRTESNG